MKKMGMGLVALMMTFAMLFAACTKDSANTGSTGSASPSGTTGSSKAPASPGAETPVLKFTVYQPYFGEKTARGTKVDQLWHEKMEAYLGVKLDITWKELPWNDFDEKMSIYLASGTYDDVFLIKSMEQVTEAGASGAIINLSDKLDLMPNYKTFMDGYDGEEGKKIVSGDGNIYAFYDSARGANNGTQWSWVYRFDKFREHNIKIPETLDELYEATKQLKALYPDSTPIGSHFKDTWYSIDKVFLYNNRTSPDLYFNGSKFVYGPIDEADRHKEVLQYLNKLYAEGLLDPEFYSQSEDIAMSKMMTGKYFIVPNTFSGFRDTNNKSTEYPQQWGFAKRPLNFHGETGWKPGSNKAGLHIDTSIGGAVISSKAPNQDLLVKLLDYQYSPEMIDLMNWGVEGETYTHDNGEYKFTDAILAEGSTMLTDYGINSSGSVRSGITWVPQDHYTGDVLGRASPAYENGQYIDDFMYTFTARVEGDESVMPDDYRPPGALSKEEQDQESSIMSAIITHRDAEALKFITGKRSFDTWDAFIDEMKKLGDYEKVLGYYNARL